MIILTLPEKNALLSQDLNNKSKRQREKIHPKVIKQLQKIY